ncbi:hypothetical protein [Halomonas sp. BMC6]|uniref:hypothetical protein n=1 Tax=Halomonas sp. BMC6 TaxID=3073244 RepID=UPI0030CD5980
MLGCINSAVVFSPESSACRDCPYFEGCHKNALALTQQKYPSASAAFLSINYSTNASDTEDALDIRLSSASERVKNQALLLNRKGFSFSKARALIKAGKNPFNGFRTQRAFITIFDHLLSEGKVRKSDLVKHVIAVHQCSASTASSLVSDVLGLGELMKAVTTTRFTAEISIKDDQ